jgi:RHS repeat-associated protein
MRTADSTTSSLVYFLGDHLGSTSITVNPDGSKIAEMRYTAWGETRYTQGVTPTDYQYTGQRNESAIGLYYYNARWYDPALGRFAQADTFVPGGVQGFDRYAYVYNSPLIYTDPSGHTCYDANGTEFMTGVPSYLCPKQTSPTPQQPDPLVIFDNAKGDWSNYPDAMDAIRKGAYSTGKQLAQMLNKIQRDLIRMGDLSEGDFHNYSPEEAFLLVYGGPVTFTLLLNEEGYAAEANYQGGINVYLPNWIASHPDIVIHELFHRLENILGIKNTVLPSDLQRKEGDYGVDPTYNGFFGGQWVGQFSLPHQTQYDYETLADMGLGWARNRWGEGSVGAQRKRYMEALMTTSLVRFIP